MDPLLWWKQRRDEFKLLIPLVRAILCIPATSAPSERLFSKASLTLTEKRNRLAADKVKDLIFLRSCWDYAESLLSSIELKESVLGKRKKAV